VLPRTLADRIGAATHGLDRRVEHPLALGEPTEYVGFVGDTHRRPGLGSEFERSPPEDVIGIDSTDYCNCSPVDRRDGRAIHRY
jgi:hypothetical protein